MEELDCELSGAVEVDFDAGQGWSEGFANARIVVNGNDGEIIWHPQLQTIRGNDCHFTDFVVDGKESAGLRQFRKEGLEAFSELKLARRLVGGEGLKPEAVGADDFGKGVLAVFRPVLVSVMPDIGEVDKSAGQEFPCAKADGRDCIVTHIICMPAEQPFAAVEIDDGNLAEIRRRGDDLPVAAVNDASKWIPEVQKVAKGGAANVSRRDQLHAPADPLRHFVHAVLLEIVVVPGVGLEEKDCVAIHAYSLAQNPRHSQESRLFVRYRIDDWHLHLIECLHR